MATLTAPAPSRIGSVPGPRRVRWGVAMAVVLLASSAATILAMRRTSATFDEIVLIAGGARGYRTGAFDLAPDHPPLMQYLYGLPAYIQRPNYPSESLGWNQKLRYGYAREFFWGVGNDPERLAFLSRLMAVLLAAGLVLATWAFARRAYGPAAAIVAGTLVAFLPDVLAHGGVAYNDVPMALMYLATLWAVDSTARHPSVKGGALVGLLGAIAVGVKYSALVIAPAALLIVGAEAFARRGHRAWARRLGVAIGMAVVAAYIGLVLIYRFDFTLDALRNGVGTQLRHVEAPGGAPNFLLGRFDPRGFWYFYPVAFLFKTSAALHLLMLLGLLGYAATWQARLEAMPPGERGAHGARARAVRGLLASRLRMPVIGSLVFGAVLLRSHLDIGFRYALPILPLLCVLTAVGVVRAWKAMARPAVKWSIAALLAWYVASPLSSYPWFISYLSEYSPGRDSAYEVLVDSSIDWGQGLLALRDFMRENNIPIVYLSYFGSARPDGYGIPYVAASSFFPLMDVRPPGPRPAWIAVSATNLEPVYFSDPRLERLRGVPPTAVVGGSIYMYRLR